MHRLCKCRTIRRIRWGIPCYGTPWTSIWAFSHNALMMVNVRRIATTVAALLLFFGRALAGMVDISLVTVGDPGNLPDPATSYGAVPYMYQIGEYDVTVGQYCAFLNAVAARGDPYGLYNPAMAPGSIGGFTSFGITHTSTSGGFSYAVSSSYNQAANCQIYDVTWGDAARFVNWLANGEPTGPEGPGTTETGTYALNGGTSNAALMAVTRVATATWVLPTVNEWYKAAVYYGGGTNSAYWTYATQSNDAPSNVLSATGTNNANYLMPNNEPPNYGFTSVEALTPVGAFADSPGPFGTYDMGATFGNGRRAGTIIADGACMGVRLTALGQI